MKTTMRKKETITGWCTKYALTRGVYQVTVVEIGSDYYPGRYVDVVPSDGCYSYILERGKTFFETHEAACTNADEQAHRKLESMQCKAQAINARIGTNWEPR